MFISNNGTTVVVSGMNIGAVIGGTIRHQASCKSKRQVVRMLIAMGVAYSDINL